MGSSLYKYCLYFELWVTELQVPQAILSKEKPNFRRAAWKNKDRRVILAKI